MSVVVLSSLLLAACDDGTGVLPPPTTEPVRPGAEAYVAALDSVLGESAGPDERSVVYLLSFDGDIGLGVQADVIDMFADSYDIRFVDDLAAAVDLDDPTHPPRDDGVVLGVGTITAEPPHRVRIERYRSAGDVRAVRLTLERREDGWHVTMTEMVPAEVLIDAV